MFKGLTQNDRVWLAAQFGALGTALTLIGHRLENMEKRMDAKIQAAIDGIKRLDTVAAGLKQNNDALAAELSTAKAKIAELQARGDAPTEEDWAALNAAIANAEDLTGPAAQEAIISGTDAE